MYKRILIFCFVNLFFMHFGNAQFYISEKKINKDKVSKKIVDYVEKNYAGSIVKYYKVKTDENAILYEAKVRTDKDRITLVFTSNSEFISIDNEVYYLDVPEGIRKKINAQLNAKFSKFEVTHCRDQNIEQRKVYELDVIAKKKRYEFRFEHDGTLIDFKEIPQKAIDFIFN